jgi:hypothetical protein
MPLSHKPLEAITAGDLKLLIEGAVAEGRRIEFKRDLPGKRDDDKREFLADVTSFANAAGGDLIFGIVESGGVASSVAPIAEADADAELRRLENIIQTAVAPRIQGVQLRAIQVTDEGFVLIVRVPRSWSLPHMVTFGNLSRFYSRTSAGKYQLDVHELRALFARSGDTADRIRQFRDDRLARITAGEGAFPMAGSALIVLHLVPFRLLDAGPSFDLHAVAADWSTVPPLRPFGFSSRYNLDGFVTHSSNDPRLTQSYLQVFRRGAIEAVDAGMLESGREHKTMIPTHTIGFEIAEKLPRYLAAQRTMGVDPPIVLLLTLLGVKDFAIPTNDPFDRGSNRIDRDVIQAPEVILEEWNVDILAAMRPALATVWNAAGLPRCSLYAADGTWLVR